MIKTHSIPEELIALPQWVIWRYMQKPGTPKPTKVPHTTMGYRASVTDPSHWSTFEFALKAAARAGFADGVGFVFAPDGVYCGIDLDACYPSDGAECAPWAEGVLQRFSDTYNEESPSGSGVKIWVRARAPRWGKWPVGNGSIEIYDRNRFFTVTSRSTGILAVADHQEDIEQLVANLDQDRGAAQSRPTIAGDTIPRGRRHPTLLSIAGTMHRRGMDLEAIEAALLVVNAKQCDPPYPPEHIHNKIIASMANWRR